MKIGNVTLENNVFLAPMAGVTDMPFRILCKKKGCGLVYTEMASAKGMHYKDEKSFKITEIAEEERPAAVQIFGSDPGIMAEIAARLNDSDAALIDINMGCPTPKIVKNGDGCALMRTPDLACEIIRRVSDATTKPVTVKIRKGWDAQSINAVEFAKAAEQSGAKAITVHGRTREQFYSGKADWKIIAEVKKAVSIPVIGNGDIFEPEDAQRMIETTGCDAVMIGRGAQGNPWIFERTVEYLKTGRLLPVPAFKERFDMIVTHLGMLAGLKGERTGVREMRKHIAWYIKGMKNSTYVKEKIFKAQTRDEILSILREYALYFGAEI